MPLVNIFLFSVLALVGLVAWVLISDYNRAVDKYNKDMEELRKQNYYEHIYQRSVRQVDEHASYTQPAQKDNWQFFPIEERKVQL